MNATIKPATIVDKLGKVKAEMAELKEKEDQLRAMLVDLGMEEIDGKLFRATVSHAVVTRVDYKAVVEKLQPSPQLLSAHTTQDERITVKVTARK